MLPILALISVFLTIANAVITSDKKNVIFFVSDGLGPAGLSLTRSFKQVRDNTTYEDDLGLEQYLIGQMRTQSSSSYITDSAAAGTAFACGIKTYNGGISIFPDTKDACGSTMEGARLQGYLTGIVSTTSMSDATPGVWAGHAQSRSDQDLMVLQQLGFEHPLGKIHDVIIGGGRCHYYNTNDTKYGEEGCRKLDERNMIDEAIADGWNYVGDKASFDSLEHGNAENISLPLLSLLFDDNFPYEIDRNPENQPRLADMTLTALNLLDKASKDQEKGFFLLVEGARIDHAGHANDPLAYVRETLEYSDAFEAAVQFAKESEVDTIIIGTSDHETGGLSVAREVEGEEDYAWKPSQLLNTTHSGEYCSDLIANYEGEDLKQFIETEILDNYLSVKNYTDEDVQAIIEEKEESLLLLNDLVSIRSQTGWSSTGHSATDVNVYAYSNKRGSYFHILDKLGGTFENEDLGNFFADYLDVDLQNVTNAIKGIPVQKSDL